jgi:hypothetical protein
MRRFATAMLVITALTAITAIATAATNIALNKPVTVSSTYSIYAGHNAVDADTSTAWNAGGYGGFIEIDLGADTPIDHMFAKAAQVPNGSPTHTMTGRTSGGTTVTLGSFTGPVVQGQWLTIPSLDLTPVRYVRITSSNPTSWVAWFEIQLFAGVFVNPTQTTSWGRMKALYR